MASDSGDGGGHRQPKDMQGLLRLCAGITDPDNPNENASFNTMSQERREWLETALSDMSTNPVSEMKKCVDLLSTDDDSDDSVDNKIQALEALVDWCEQIDLAIDFHKIGGFDTFPLCFHHSEPEIRWGTMELIATLVQNNPYCQRAVLDGGLLPQILEILDSDGDSTVKTKSLYALSCLVRDMPEAQTVFLQHDGFSVIMRAMQADVEKLKIKSAFFLSVMCTDRPEYKDILCDIGMVDQFVGHLSEDHVQYHEHLMSALLTVVRDHPRSVQECLRPELNAIDMLEHKRRELQGKDEFKEELEYTEELLQILTSRNTSQFDDTEPDIVR